MPSYRLFQEIVKLSVADDWDEAVREWGLQDVFESETQETCLCGHFPIIEICVLHNTQNGATAEVGNCCVKKFIGLPSDKIFTAVKRVRKDDEKALNLEAIEHCRNKRWINQWEYDFLINTRKKRKLSAAQLKKRQQINARVLRNVKRAARKTENGSG
jgi:hypothetical protein